MTSFRGNFNMTEWSGGALEGTTGEGGMHRTSISTADGDGRRLVETLEECTRHLETLCGHLGAEDSEDAQPAEWGEDLLDAAYGDRYDAEARFVDRDVPGCSVVDMADECMHLLASLRYVLKQERHSCRRAGCVGMEL